MAPGQITPGLCQCFVDVGTSQHWYITDKFGSFHSRRQWALQTSLLPLVSSHPHCHHSSCNPKWSCPSAMLNVNLKGDRWASNSRKSVGHWQILLWKEHSFIVATVYIKVWNKLWLCDQKRILCDNCVVWKVTVQPSTVLHFLWSALTLQCLISKLILRTEAHLLNTPCVTIVSNADIL